MKLIQKGSTPMTSSPPNTPSSVIITLGIRFQHTTLGRHRVCKNSFWNFGVDQLTWGEVIIMVKRVQVKDKEILLKEVRDLPPTLIPAALAAIFELQR